MHIKCFSTFICYGWAYGCTLTLYHWALNITSHINKDRMVIINNWHVSYSYWVVLWLWLCHRFIYCRCTMIIPPICLATLTAGRRFGTHWQYQYKFLRSSWHMNVCAPASLWLCMHVTFTCMFFHHDHSFTPLSHHIDEYHVNIH